MEYLHKVALYARFSSDQQRQESIDAQIRAMKKYCQDRHYVIVEIYQDAAKSATSDKRPAFQKMIADSASGKFDIILVHKLDRFSRDRYDASYYRRKLKKNGVRLYSVLENMAGSESPEAVLLESLIDGLAEFYSKNLKREVLKGLNENAYKAMHTGGKPPLGFSVGEDKKLIIKEDEAEIVRLIFSLYDKGFQFSYIIKKLHEMGYTTQRGNAFSKSSISDILRNEKYAGIYTYSKLASKDSENKRNGHKFKPDSEIIRVEGGCEAIVSKEQFMRVARRLESNANKYAGREGKEHYLLTGKIVCGVCGSHMHGSSRYSGRNKYYQSTYRCPKLRHVCGNREINRIYLDNYVNDHMVKNVFTLENLTKIKAVFNKSINKRIAMQEASGDKLRKKIKDVDKQIANIMELVEKGAISSVVVDKLNTLTDQKEGCECKLASLNKFSENEIEWTSKEVMEEFNKCTLGSEEYKVLLQRFIKEVIVYPYEIKIVLKAGEFYDFTKIPMDLSSILSINLTRRELYSLFDSRVIKANRSEMTGV